MAKRTALQKQIDTATGATRTERLYSGRSGRDVNMDRVQRGKRAGFGTTTQKRQDIVAALNSEEWRQQTGDTTWAD